MPTRITLKACVTFGTSKSFSAKMLFHDASRVRSCAHFLNKATEAMRCHVCVGAALLCFLGFSLSPIAAQSGSAQVIPSGRFQGTIDDSTGLAQLPLLFSWPASRVYATFVGDSITATLSTLPPSTIYDAYSRFAFYVDQQLIAIETSSPGATGITWSTTGLGSGMT